MSVEYIGRRLPADPGGFGSGRCQVLVIRSGTQPGFKHEEELDPRLDLLSKSLTGFEWGYSGSGPAQLALAILAHCVGDKMALQLYQHFKVRYIAQLPHDGWNMTADEVRGAAQLMLLET